MILTVTPDDLLKGTGTENGVSKYKRVSECAARDYFSREIEAAKKANIETGDEDEESEGLNVGTAFHALKALFMRGTQFSIQYGAGEDPRDITVKEAVRLADEHNKRFPRESYGRILDVERLFPATDEEKARLEAYGFPITGQADIIVELTEQDCDRLFKLRKVMLPGPGVYNWDYKTAKARKKGNELFYRHEIQFILYPYFLQQLVPQWNVRGSIGDIIVKHKELKDESFETVFCSTPNEEAARIMIDWLKRQHAKRTEAASTEYNLAACVDYMTQRPCTHLASGRCPWGLARMGR